MKWLKRTFKKTLAARGYELVRSQELASLLSHGNFVNFVNLAQAYEQRLNEDKNCILPNETRLKLLARLLGTEPSEAYFIIQALSKCKDVAGDVCEFGVAQGETSTLIANEIALHSNKRLHLFDSFEGLPKPTGKDQLKDDIFSLGNMEAYAGTMSCPEEMVHTRLETISFPRQRYVIHKGFFEQLIREDKDMPTEVCFAYVDFDFYEPITLALTFLHPRTRNGAIIIVDDYDFFSTGAKAAVDEFLEAKNSNNPVYEFFVPNTRYGHCAILAKQG